MYTPKMYDLMYRYTEPNWDTGEIPDPVIELAGQPRGRVLDLGCGTGTQAIYLAQQGFVVVGVDGSPTAIQRAQMKAAMAGVSLEFFIQDVTRLNVLQDPFDLVLDIGCFHGMGKPARQAYLAELQRLTHPGSQYLMWAVDYQFPSFGVTPQQVQEAFQPAFCLTRIAPSKMHNQPSTWYWLKRE